VCRMGVGGVGWGGVGWGGVGWGRVGWGGVGVVGLTTTVNKGPSTAAVAKVHGSLP
jgi:hypothetical protein